MQEIGSPFRAGQHVVIRDEPWRVVETEVFEFVTVLTIRGIGNDNRGDTMRVLTPFDTATTLAPATRIIQRSRRAVLAAAAFAIADAPPWDQCWTAASATIDILGWQLEPAIAAVRGDTRILLADEVGLGKTIQASLIVSELMARGLAQRVLVLTPAALREQWAAEMAMRFRLTPVVLDQAALAALSTTLPPDINPWQTAPLIVSSIDLAKRPEVRAALASVPIDVLVVDEAHHLTTASDRAAVVADLASRSTWVVLATATPHSGDERAYRFLLGLGDVGVDTLATFRRSAAHVRTAQSRRSKLIAVQPTAAESALLVATMDYARALWRSRDSSAGAGLVAAIIARRAASLASAARKTLQRRLQLLRERTAPEVPMPLPWEDDDAADADVADAVLRVRGLADLKGEIAKLTHLVALAASAESRSSKVAAIRRLLQRSREQLIVFSEYRDVVEVVATGLRDIAPVVVLHGGLPPCERREAIQAFTAGLVRTLVTTDAAGEGLNLHQRCRWVVNLELPWNPRRLEQRIGRVDRLGQTRRVHAVHLVHRGSFEARVIARLTQRAATAQLPFAAPLQEDKPLAARNRRLRAFAASLNSSASPAVYSARRRVTQRHLHLVFSASLVDGSGRLVRRHLSALRAHSSLPVITRAALRAVTTRADVRALLAEDVQRAVAAAHSSCAQTAAAIERRCHAIAVALAARRQRARFQASLFDRRAEQQADADHAALAQLQSHAQKRAIEAQALRCVTAGMPHLIAAWLGD
ncbi:MAG: DEAD/DEAH box helicase [Acidobacteria bacterium]|nr:DEAD/DEAH box helicase [Acidobacteriota bacterium]